MLENYKSNASPVATRQQDNGVKAYAANPAIQRRFAEVLGDKAPAFIASVVGAVNANPKLKKCEPASVFGSAMIAATLNLAVVPTLGQAALVPYGNKVQFQIMTRGIVQLAQRTGLYKCINAGEVYEDEYEGEDLLTGEVMFHRVQGGYRDKGNTQKIVGYFAYIETTTGFRKVEYWTKADVENHGRKYSKSYSSGPWKDNFDAMAKKTVLKSLLNHYGPMSVDSQLATAMVKDQMVNSNGQDTYEDSIADALIVNDEEPEAEEGIVVDEATGEIVEEKPAAPAVTAPSPQAQAQAQPKANGPESFEDDSEDVWGNLDQAWESGQSL